MYDDSGVSVLMLLTYVLNLLGDTVESRWTVHANRRRQWSCHDLASM